jgi:hypothetical protein
MKTLALLAAAALLCPLAASAQSLDLIIAIEQERLKPKPPAPKPTPPQQPAPKPPAPTPPAPAPDAICERCDGTGQLDGVTCLACGGDGRTGGPAVAAESPPARIKWVESAHAAELGKPLLIFFTAEDCGHCHVLQAKVEAMDAAGRLPKTAATFTCVRDVSPSMRQPSAAAKWCRVTSYPQIVIYDPTKPREKCLTRFVGSCSEQELANRLNYALDWVSRP